MPGLAPGIHALSLPGLTGNPVTPVVAND